MLLQVKETDNGRMLSAKELHEYLQTHRIFTSWFQSKLGSYQYEKGVDYQEVWMNTQTNEILKKEVNADEASANGYTKDYLISFGMAKEICVLENSKLSRKARKYLMMLEENHSKFLQSKLYILDEGKIDMEKLGQWQEFLTMAGEFEPLLQTFRKQLLSMIDQCCYLEMDLKNSTEELNGIKDYNLNI